MVRGGKCRVGRDVAQGAGAGNDFGDSVIILSGIGCRCFWYTRLGTTQAPLLRDPRRHFLTASPCFSKVDNANAPPHARSHLPFARVVNFSLQIVRVARYLPSSLPASAFSCCAANCRWCRTSRMRADTAASTLVPSFALVSNTCASIASANLYNILVHDMVRSRQTIRRARRFGVSDSAGESRITATQEADACQCS